MEKTLKAFLVFLLTLMLLVLTEGGRDVPQSTETEVYNPEGFGLFPWHWHKGFGWKGGFKGGGGKGPFGWKGGFKGGGPGGKGLYTASEFAEVDNNAAGHEYQNMAGDNSGYDHKRPKATFTILGNNAYP